MKKYIFIIIYSLLIMGIVACADSPVVSEPEYGTEDIVIDFTSGSVVSRSQDLDYESRITHIDVLIYTDAATDNEKKLFHYERLSVNASEGKIILGKTREDFTENEKYWVYVVANSSADVTVMANLANVNLLKSLERTDRNIHLTSLTHLATESEPIPATFLMDGVCYVKPETEGDYDMPSVIPIASAVNINNSESESTVLKVVLRRAAAKIKVRLHPGENVKFDNTISGSNTGYYLRNMPISTLVVDPQTDPVNVEVRRSHKLNDDFFEWKSDENTGKYYIELTAYVYSHQWDFAEFFERGTSLVVDIPIYYNADAFEVDGDGNLISETKTYAKSYYQIMLRPYENQSFSRNVYYSVDVTINAPGAEEDSGVETIPVLRYDAYPWTNVAVNIDGTNGPVYLNVNQDTLKMYNVAQDLNSLYYTSSSKITSVVIKDVSNGTPTPYYVNKFGVETYVEPSSSGIRANVAIADAISGNIEVYSNVPTNNAIRYFVVEITNADGLTESVVVEQYPLIYITNTLGYYSYRDDFKGTSGNVTTYENGYEPYYTNTSYSGGQWSYSNGNNGSFFKAKYVTSTETSGQNKGKSTLAYYYWTKPWYNNTYTKDATTYKTASNGGNARMYHIRVSATSNDYVIGRPRLDSNGYTDTGVDNAKLVSPSFALASQLGALQSPTLTLENSAEHCNRYVETYRDANNNVVHLNDWRLPTYAEIQFIMNTQYKPNSAMDEVLAGKYYMSADGTIFENTNENRTGGGGTYVRCVRDVY